MQILLHAGGGNQAGCSDTVDVSPRYIPDPSSRQVELSEQEISAMLEEVGSLFPKNSSAVEHLLMRVLATVRSHNQYRSRTQSQFVEVSAKSKAFGQSTTLNPLDAARFLKSSDLEAILAQRGIDASQKVNELKAELQNESRKLQVAIGQVQSSLLVMLEDETLSAASRLAAEKALVTLAKGEVVAEQVAGSETEEEPQATPTAQQSWIKNHQSETEDELGDLFE